VASAAVCFCAAGVALRERFGVTTFLVLTVLVLLGNIAVASYQAFIDSGFKVFRPRHEEEQFLSGLVFHRNYLAGILEIATPLWLAFVLTTKKKAARLLFSLVTIASILLCFFSLSRGGFAAMCVGGAVTFLVFLASKWPKTELRGKWLSALGLLIGTLALIVLFFLWSEVLGVRNSGIKTEDLLGELKGRLVMSGVAFEIWQTSPMIGTGSQSYGYLFTRYYSSDLHGGFLGYARMAHNEYAQTLAEYGLIGFILLVTLILWFGCLVVRRMRENPGDWKAPAFAGALGAELLRSTIDFNLHLAPSLLLFAFLAGAVAVVPGPAKRAWLDKGLSILLVVIVSGFGLVTFRGELQAADHIVKYERAKIEGDWKTAVRERELLLESAPEFRLLRQRARWFTPADSAPWNERALLRAEECWQKVIERHPYDGESLANRARVLDKLGRFKESEVLHRRAIEAAGNRERKYGVFFGYAHHLIRRAQVARSERRPGESLFLLMEALDLVRYTLSQRYEEKEEARVTLMWIQEQISFLEGARIEKIPVEVIDWKNLANK
jgi:O-antigen ligase